MIKPVFEELVLEKQRGPGYICQGQFGHGLDGRTQVWRHHNSNFWIFLRWDAGAFAISSDPFLPSLPFVFILDPY